MAKRDVYKYYTQCTQQMVNLQNSLKALKESLGDKEVDRDKLEYLSNTIELMRANCDRLSYIMYLLNQPSIGIFRKRYDQVNENLFKRLKELKVTKEDILLENSNILDEVNKYIETIKEDALNGK